MMATIKFQMPILNYNKIIKVLWFLICLFGAIVQNTFVTIEYFKYPTVSEVLFETEENFIPPAFSLCFNLVDIREPTAFPEGHVCHEYNPANNYSNKRRHECKDIMTLNYSLKDQLDNISRDIFPEIMSITRSDGTRNKFISNESSFMDHIDQYLWDGAKCYRFRNNPNPEYRVSSDLLTSLTVNNNWFGDVTGMIPNVEAETEFSFIIHDPKTYPRSIWSNFIVLYPLASITALTRSVGHTI